MRACALARASDRPTIFWHNHLFKNCFERAFYFSCHFWFVLHRVCVCVRSLSAREFDRRCFFLYFTSLRIYLYCFICRSIKWDCVAVCRVYFFCLCKIIQFLPVDNLCVCLEHLRLKIKATHNAKMRKRDTQAERARTKKIVGKFFGAYIESWSHGNDTVVNTSVASHSLTQFEYQTK